MPIDTANLAVNGGPPVRANLLPYGRQSIDAEDLAAVERALTSDWLTTGPNVGEFEAAFARTVGAGNAIAVNSGTAALHVAMHAIGVSPGDEVVVPAMTFAASANCVLYQGATPVFADVDPETLLLDPASVSERLSPRTRAVIAVDYAGQPCDYTALRTLLTGRDVVVVADACHALGAAVGDARVGTIADMSAFSLHPVKHVTTGEGGMLTTSEARFASRARVFRNHGITSDHRQREAQGSWFYEMSELGFNYRLTDFQSALGTSQLRKLDGWIERRRTIARAYDDAFLNVPAVRPLRVRQGVRHAYHLYVVRLTLEALRVGRAEVFAALRAEGIGVNVHYIPVHMHPYYQQRFGTGQGLCPAAEAAYEEILSLPMFPAMSDADVRDVIEAVTKVTTAYAA